MKARRHLLLQCRLRQQIPGKLLDRELTERHIAVERLDHPLPVTPRVGPRTIALISVAVRISSKIQPVPPPFLSIVRRRQQPLNLPLVSVGGGVGPKLSNFDRG